jgi:HK97 family phage prohead protease
MPKIEVRDVPATVQLRAEGEGKTPNRLVGYAARFGVDSCPLFDVFGGGKFIEVIRPGAFTRTLRENDDLRALYNHDPSIVLGRTKSGTLRLHEDATGLAFEVDLPDTQAGRDVRAMVARGDIDGCSFGFKVRKDDVAKRGDGTTVRTLLDVDLVEISPAVVFPAYASTSVVVRACNGGASRPRLELLRAKLRLLNL